MKPIIASFIILLSTAVHAQWWVEPAVNIGTTRFHWGESVELKTSQPTWEVQFGYRSREPFQFRGSVYGRRSMAWTSEGNPNFTPFQVNGVAFGKKDNQSKGSAPGSSAGSKGIVVDATSTRGMVECMVGGASPLPSARPLVRAEYHDFTMRASGEVDGKTVTAEESIRRWHPQVGLAWEYNTGPSWVRLMGAVGQKSSHIEGSVSWWVRPGCWVSVGGKRDYLSLGDNGRLEDARLTVGVGVRW